MVVEVMVGIGNYLIYKDIMPLHDFHCNTCDITFEEFHSQGEEIPCKQCGLAADIQPIGTLAPDFINIAAVDFACNKSNDSTFLTNKPITHREY
jgi:hypothetical protein